MDFSPDGRLLAYAFSNEDVSLIVLWDVALQAVRSVTKGNQAMHRAKI
jgi:Tol biopolymer transport system component